ncbi:hypothetical protein [Pseudonocardia sp.]|uniref:hypothetical protein n=1 Tax=Pseudonocardia sp. TaxID=60912 RepID=UPI0026158FA4|nr:hypothetical protein [Pseudonocardia sp.]MCW2716629.1 acyl transferase [Pseudonocardia sp.]MDT7613104.1 hypothetical protein [Pseudonocardiales bacterium]
MSVSPLRAAAGAAVLAVLLAGCGGTTAPADSAVLTAAPSTTAAPTTAPTTTPAPTTTTPAPVAVPTKPPRSATAPVPLLPWPTANPTRLQAAVDGGAQPWLLDPTDLAESYVQATYGWAEATATPVPGGTSARTTVDVRNTDGARRTLTVAQPGRKGQGGIWLVTADTKA